MRGRRKEPLERRGDRKQKLKKSNSWADDMLLDQWPQLSQIGFTGSDQNFVPCNDSKFAGICELELSGLGYFRFEKR